MGHHQPHPSDHAADRDGGGGDQRGAHHRQKTQPGGVDPHGPGLVVPQGEQIELPAQEKQGEQPGGHSGGDAGHIGQTGARQAAHEPVGDLRELAGGVGHQLEGGGGGEQGADHHARQHQVEHPVPGRPLSHQVDQHHRGQGPEKGGQGGALIAHPHQDGQRRPEGRAGGGPQHIRGGHGILKHPLVGRPGTGQAAPHQAGQDDAGQADVQDGGVLVARPRLLQGEEAGEENPAGGAGIHPVPPQAEGENEQRRQQYAQCQQHPAAGVFCFGQGPVPPLSPQSSKWASSAGISARFSTVSGSSRTSARRETGPQKGLFSWRRSTPSTGVGPSSRVKTARWNTGEHRSRKPSSSISSRERRPAGADSRCPPRRVKGGPVGPHAMGLHRGNAQGLPRLQQLQRQMAARPIPVGTEPAGGLRPPRQIAGDGGGLSALERAGQKNVHHTASPLYWGKTKRRILKKDTATQGGPCAEGRHGLSFLFKHGRRRRFPRHPAAPAGAIGPPALGHPVGGRTRNSIHLYL